LSTSGVDISDVVKKTGGAGLDVEDQLVMETKLKIIEILQVGVASLVLFTFWFISSVAKDGGALCACTARAVLVFCPAGRNRTYIRRKSCAHFQGSTSCGTLPPSLSVAN
jgi:hypothetical protein